MSDVVIRCEGLGKKYRIGVNRQRYTALRDVVTERLAALGRRLLGRSTPADLPYEELWALKDVSFEVKRGECVGVIGRNGAGKSTLLKLLSRITEPTTGRIHLKGRVASLLEVGTGFHGELTGRENIFLNGAILGMRREEIKRKFDEIVAFAEIEKFLDTPVKHYSSGMYMRLAFAVAAHLEPEILIVDEVLAVGDAEFQRKCLGRMGDVAKAGRTVLFVSHNMAAIQNLCSQGVLLERGQINVIGSSREAITEYLSSGKNPAHRFNVAGRIGFPTDVEIIDAWIEKDGIRTDSLLFGDLADVVLEFCIKAPVRFSVELILRQQDALPVAFAPSGLALGWDISPPLGKATVRCTLPPVRYATGKYSIDLIAAVTGEKFLDYVECGLSFIVECAAVGERNWAFDQSSGQGFAIWDVDYRLDENCPAV